MYINHEVNTQKHCHLYMYVLCLYGPYTHRDQLAFIVVLIRSKHVSPERAIGVYKPCLYGLNTYRQQLASRSEESRFNGRRRKVNKLGEFIERQRLVKTLRGKIHQRHGFRPPIYDALAPLPPATQGNRLRNSPIVPRERGSDDFGQTYFDVRYYRKGLHLSVGEDVRGSEQKREERGAR